jgi:anti-anti-sigma regulatory factor
MPIALEQHDDSNLIRLEGAIDIAFAEELKKLLLQALGSGKPVCISLRNATCLDVTTIQLLWAAEREAKAASVRFAFADELPEPVSSALARVGFERFPVPVDAL